MTRESTIDFAALKAQVDADIEARMAAEAGAAHYIQRRGFRVGKFNLAVALDAASEVAALSEVYHLPGAPAGVIGLVNRHGRVVPAIDLLSLSGARSGTLEDLWLLVCGKGDEAVGLVIDSLPERIMFSQTEATDLTAISGEMTHYADAAYRKHDQTWLDMNLEKLFASIFNLEAA